MTMIVPDSKRFIKGILITFVVIMLAIYLQHEYLNWSETSGDTKYLTLSYIFKNIIILISIVYLFFYLKKPVKKIYERKNHKKIPGEEKIYTKRTDEDYFDRFRNKEKLKTKAERILEKNGKK